MTSCRADLPFLSMLQVTLSYLYTHRDTSLFLVYMKLFPFYLQAQSSLFLHFEVLDCCRISRVFFGLVVSHKSLSMCSSFPKNRNHRLLKMKSVNSKDKINDNKQPFSAKSGLFCLRHFRVSFSRP